MKALYKQFENKKPIGYVSMNPYFGVNVYDISFNTVTTAWNSNGNAYGFGREKINYTASGRAYFRKNGQRIYFDNVIKNMLTSK